MDRSSPHSRRRSSTGTVIVWNKTSEKGINARLAERLPGEKAFLDDANVRIVDLMDVFSEQMFVHPAFKGKTSIKFVLPALVPELSYKALAIQEGGAASETWNKIVTGARDADGVARERKNLRRRYQECLLFRNIDIEGHRRAAQSKRLDWGETAKLIGLNGKDVLHLHRAGAFSRHDYRQRFQRGHVLGLDN